MGIYAIYFKSTPLLRSESWLRIEKERREFGYVASLRDEEGNIVSGFTSPEKEVNRMIAPYLYVHPGAVYDLANRCGAQKTEKGLLQANERIIQLIKRKLGDYRDKVKFIEVKPEISSQQTQPIAQNLTPQLSG